MNTIIRSICPIRPKVPHACNVRYAGISWLMGLLACGIGVSVFVPGTKSMFVNQLEAEWLRYAWGTVLTVAGFGCWLTSKVEWPRARAGFCVALAIAYVLLIRYYVNSHAWGALFNAATAVYALLLVARKSWATRT